MLKRFTLVFMFMLASCTFMPVAAGGLSILVAEELAKVTILNPVTDIVAKENRRFNVTGEDHALIAKDTNSFTDTDGWEGFGKVTENVTTATQGNINLPYEVGWRSS